MSFFGADELAEVCQAVAIWALEDTLVTDAIVSMLTFLVVHMPNQHTVRAWELFHMSLI